LPILLFRSLPGRMFGRPCTHRQQAVVIYNIEELRICLDLRPAWHSGKTDAPPSRSHVTVQRLTGYVGGSGASLQIIESGAEISQLIEAFFF
jgi:hypothetical protein